MTDNSEKIRFWINEEAFFTEPGTTVSSLLKKSHGVEMPCGGRHACGKCMVYAKGGFAAPSETEQKLLGAERLAQGIRLACFLEAVPDGKINALQQEADGDETICVSTPSAPSVTRAASISPAPPPERASAGAVCRSCARREDLPLSRRGGGYRYNDNCSRPLSGRQGCRNDGRMESAVRVRSGCHQPDRSFSGGKSR